MHKLFPGHKMGHSMIFRTQQVKHLFLLHSQKKRLSTKGGLSGGSALLPSLKSQLIYDGSFSSLMQSNYQHQVTFLVCPIL